ncbi:PAS domain S-box protein [Halococcus qingdaonensis]|uniref:PAS domain S-box protein n=1 Tax=Halococcus qingdaonensis TaxID=224402 RepID=UPI00211686FA|nr:PAS domain S-box protein [Halococcus qingdaonensis]
MVDDEPAVADFASTSLERIDDRLTVATEADAEAVLDRIEGTEIDCIVSDYRMPGMDGLALLERVRERHPNIPFILFTGEGGEGVASEAISAGVTDYLRKGTGSERYELLANSIVNAVESYRAECALAESERLYRSLIDATPDAVVIADAETGRIVETNDVAATLFGRPREELVGMDQTALHPAEQRERYRELFERHAASSGTDAARFGDGSAVLIETADGETIPVDLRARTVQMDDRTLLHGVFRERSTRTERDRDRERAITDGFFEALPDPAYVLDPEGTMVRWNEEYASVVGYDDTTIAGTNYSEFVPDADYDRIDERIQEILRTGESAVVESALVTNAGETIPHQFSGARVPLGNGYGIVGVGRNVVEQRRREQAIGALHEATRRFVAARDEDGIADAVTTTIEEILGFPIAVVRLHDDERDSLDPVSVTAATHDRLGERPRYARGEGFPWRAFRAGEAIVVGEANAPDDGIPLRHRLYLPLGDHGTITVASPDESFDDSTVRLARVLAANAEAALDRLEREERLRRYGRMLDAAGDMIYTLDADGRFRTVNDTLVAETGYGREELLGEHVSMLLDEDDIALGRSVIQRLLADGANAVSDSYDATVHTADGDSIPCEIQLTALEGDAGFAGTVGVVRDITVHKRHERLLQALHDASREMMAATTRREVADVAIETAADVLDMELNGIWLHEAGELRPVAISEAGTELFDAPPTFAGGESLAWTVFESGTMQRYDRVDRQSEVHNPNTPIRSELLLPLGDHGVLTIGATEPGVFDDRDVSLAKLLAANTEAALERAERERELVVERDRLTALFENVPDAALRYELVDGEPITRRVNERFETVFGHSAGEITGENAGDYIVPSDREMAIESVDAALADGTSRQTTVRRLTADGVRDFLVHIAPLEPGERKGGYAIYTDITDQKRRERDLERQNELLDGFASVISHDLRNPMGVARGRLELAEADHHSEHHDAALWALDRMDTLIEDVLTLARQGRVIDDPEPVELAGMAERAWRTVDGEDATIDVELSGTVAGDPDRLTRLFANLFRNAIDHAGSDVHVTVGTTETGFFVADDGPGIPDGECERIFEHGYSTSESGTGLGLMIVRRIADAHGWSVSVADTADGARFEVDIGGDGEQAVLPAEPGRN